MAAGRREIKCAREPQRSKSLQYGQIRADELVAANIFDFFAGRDVESFAEVVFEHPW